MFERYTEEGRRVIFFARYEASRYGSDAIETEHLLLGLLREHKGLSRLTRDPRLAETVRNEVDKTITRREPIPTSVEVPLSMGSTQALKFAAEEADELQHRHIGSEHILLGLLRVEDSMAAQILAGHKINVHDLRKIIVTSDRTKQPDDPSGQLWAPVIVPDRTDQDAALILQNFLDGLRAGATGIPKELLSPTAQFIDASGRRWSGKDELNQKFDELFAPFAARKAMYLLEETVCPVEGLCVASLLWQNVPLPDETPKGLCRMLVTLGLGQMHDTGWAIYSVQVTPIKGL
jgi:hypothetical protein